VKTTAILTLLSILNLPLMAEGPRSTVPRSGAEKYAAHAKAGNAAIGATLLTSKDVRKTFSADLNRCCRVVEVGLYPFKGEPIDVSTGDFILRLAGTETAVRASSGALVAAQLQRKNSGDRGITTLGEVHVGYESGTDPITGQRVHGVESGVGVGVGNSLPRAPSPDRDRDLMQLELTEKALSDGTAPAPVAGYLYFSFSKDNKKVSHELEYTLNGQKALLKLD
jgi:hypothetical protein